MWGRDKIFVPVTYSQQTKIENAKINIIKDF